MKYSQKGAMFGLDARIALAIFGALSVITGAALYSAIQDSKVVSILTEMDNVDKAITSHYLDTGVYPAVNDDTTTFGILKVKELVSSSTTGWLGPYLTFASGSDTDLTHPSYGKVTVYRDLDADWTDPAITGSKCTKDAACSIFICYEKIPDDIKAALDVKIDGTAGANTGNFRYTAGADKLGCKKGTIYDSSII